MSVLTTPRTPGQIIYPDSDGKPMADNTLQFRWIVIIKENLEALFQNNPDVAERPAARLREPGIEPEA